jgi:hypothetical protein
MGDGGIKFKSFSDLLRSLGFHFHTYGKWHDNFKNSMFQHRVCNECGYKQERMV